MSIKYLFLSDLHIGHCYFTYNDEMTLINLFRSKKYDKIFILGDMIDSWVCTQEYIKKRYSYLIGVINLISRDTPLVITLGNHDPSFDSMKKLFPYSYICYKYEERDFVAFHGDEYDILLYQLQTVAKIFYPFHQFLARKGFILNYFIRSSMHRYKSYVSNKNPNSVILTIEKKALKYNSKMVIMGHTHFPKLYKNKYVNCGDWTHNRTYVYFDGKEFNLIDLKSTK